MVLECELKYLDADLKRLSDHLEDVGGKCLGRYFESNLVFDYPDRSLKAKGILLRLRQKQGQAVLTVKRPPDEEMDTVLKIFEEIETGVDDFNVTKRALEAVGFVVAFAYEKVREKWRYAECVICLDTLPFGDYVEIEGTEKSVPVCASRLGLDGLPTSISTYHALNIEYRQAKGLEPDESFVFSADRRADLLREIGEE